MMLELISKNIATEFSVADAFFKSAMENELPIAFWRKPNEPTIHLIADLFGQGKAGKSAFRRFERWFFNLPIQQLF